MGARERSRAVDLVGLVVFGALSVGAAVEAGERWSNSGLVFFLGAGCTGSVLGLVAAGARGSATRFWRFAAVGAFLGQLAVWLVVLIGTLFLRSLLGGMHIPW